jgi:hypothetical protein
MDRTDCTPEWPPSHNSLTDGFQNSKKMYHCIGADCMGWRQFHLSHLKGEAASRHMAIAAMPAGPSATDRRGVRRASRNREILPSGGNDMHSR